MREVVTYVAYDETEFDTMEECEEYERVAFDSLEEVIGAYEFFLANGQEIQIFLNDIAKGIYDIERAYDECAQIRVKHPISQVTEDFLYANTGFDPLPYEPGLYKIGFNKYTWIKVGD